MLLFCFEVNSKLVTPEDIDSADYYNHEKHFGYQLYWCTNNTEPQFDSDYPDFYIIKKSGTGTANSYGVTLIKKNKFSNFQEQPEKLVNLGFHRSAAVSDLNNDGVCEITVKVSSHGRKWGPNAGYGLITKIFSVRDDKLIDVTNEMTVERDFLYRKETDRMINGYLLEINRELYSRYNPKNNAHVPVLNFWYHILAINPNKKGIDLFNKYRYVTISKNHAKEMEDNLFNDGYWSKEFYNSHPLLNEVNFKKNNQ